MSCEFKDDCPFLRANKCSEDSFVKQVIKEYCDGCKPGCVHCEAKQEYNTFLAMNQAPDNTLLTT